MAHEKTSNQIPPAGPAPARTAGAEVKVRRLIGGGKCKAALESAKDLHKARQTAESEALLIEAYGARIQELLRQGMPVEAKALLALVRERYPAALGKLDELAARVALRLGALDDMVRPLQDSNLPPERRAAVEQAIQTEVWDLAALATCAALPADHPLRAAAGALDRALTMVTSGPTPEETAALPEVSFRSPLASWKMLVQAIGSFYRGEDELCRRRLAAVKPDSVPARLVPALTAL